MRVESPVSCLLLILHEALCLCKLPLELSNVQCVVLLGGTLTLDGLGYQPSLLVLPCADLDLMLGIGCCNGSLDAAPALHQRRGTTTDARVELVGLTSFDGGGNHPHRVLGDGITDAPC